MDQHPDPPARRTCSFTLRGERREIHARVTLRLSRSEFNLLEYLANHPGTCPLETLATELGKGTLPRDLATTRNQVHKLRQRLRLACPDLAIITEIGRGYRLACPCRDAGKI